MFVVGGNIQQYISPDRTTLTLGHLAVCLGNANYHFWDCKKFSVYVTTLQKMLPICLFPLFHALSGIHSPLLKSAFLLILHTSSSVSLAMTDYHGLPPLLFSSFSFLFLSPLLPFSTLYLLPLPPSSFLLFPSLLISFPPFTISNK